MFIKGLVFIPKHQGQPVVCSDASTFLCRWHPQSSNLSFSYHPSPSLPMFSLVFLFSPFPQPSYVVLFSLSSPHSFAQRAPIISDDVLSNVLQYLQHMSTLLAHHWQSHLVVSYHTSFESSSFLSSAFA
ncbi:unnamed protein product [Clavelina lepadiformis]|uniref:Uncharacterized protein n=1 Tax=Clavelina lepadiformis TaxID=159417 RepID=A0ABP0H045_CLALP